MSNEESALGSTRRTPRQGVGGSPVGSWLTIALAVVAVIAGFLILKNITDDSGTASPDAGSGEVDPSSTDPANTLVDVVVPVTEATTTTTIVQRVTEGASAVVANANTVGGSAGSMSKTLELAGYTMLEPVNASGANLETSIVYFDAANALAEVVAQSIARDLGGVEVLPLPTPAPTVSGDLGEAHVLVLLGDAEAGKTLEELAPPGAAVDAGGVAAPDPSDGEVPVTAPADAVTGDGAGEDDGAG